MRAVKVRPVLTVDIINGDGDAELTFSPMDAAAVVEQGVCPVTEYHAARAKAYAHARSTEELVAEMDAALAALGDEPVGQAGPFSLPALRLTLQAEQEQARTRADVEAEVYGVKEQLTQRAASRKETETAITTIRTTIETHEGEQQELSERLLVAGGADAEITDVERQIKELRSRLAALQRERETRLQIEKLMYTITASIRLLESGERTHRAELEALAAADRGDGSTLQVLETKLASMTQPKVQEAAEALAHATAWTEWHRAKEAAGVAHEAADKARGVYLGTKALMRAALDGARAAAGNTKLIAIRDELDDEIRDLLDRLTDGDGFTYLLVSDDAD